MSKITCLSVIVECLFFGGFAGAADSTTSWRREWEKTLEGAMTIGQLTTTPIDPYGASAGPVIQP